MSYKPNFLSEARKAVEQDDLIEIARLQSQIEANARFLRHMRNLLRQTPRTVGDSDNDGECSLAN